MTDYDFVLDINALTLATTTFKNGVKHLNNIWQTVENVKTNIHSNWVGQSADAYVDKLFTQQKEFTRRTEEIKVLIEDLEYITNEAEKMNRIALSFAGYIANSSATRTNTVVSINKTSIREAIKSCADLEGIYAKQLERIKDAASDAYGLKYARVVSSYEFDTPQRKIKDNIKRISGLKDALVKYLRDMQVLEDEICARFSGAFRRPAILDEVASLYGGAYASALMALGIDISNKVSIVSDIVEPYVSENYKFNSSFTFNGFIHDQNSGDAAQLKMGYFTGDWNGCGWVAAYNVGVMVGQNFQPADIIRYYDSHGGALVDGAFGVNPLAINMYLNSQGVKAKIDNAPIHIDAKIEASAVSILTYLHDSGGHYTAIQYVDGMYYAYNNSQNWTTAPQPIPSIEAWLKERNFLALSLITIPKEVTK